MSIFKRPEKVKELYNKLHNGKIKVIAGVRRCGKTYLLDHLFYNYLTGKKSISKDKIKILYLTGEHKDFRAESNFRNLLNDLILDSVSIIVIDEVQEIENFQKILIDFVRDNPTIDFFVTGSNSNILSSDIIDYFKESADSIFVYPLTFNEIKKVRKKYLLKDYLQFGGLPCIVNAPKDKKSGELKTIYDTVYQLDIKERAKKIHFSFLSEVDEDEFLKIIFSSATPLSPVSIANKMCERYSFNKNDKKVFRQDILNFLSIIEKSFLFYPFDNNEDDTEYHGFPNKKYYCCDCGIVYERCNVAVHKAALSLETAVFLHLKHNNIIAIGKQIKDERNCTIGEIDFNYDLKHIQVVYTLNDYNYERETNSLLLLDDDLEKIVVYVLNITNRTNSEINFIEASVFLTSKP